MASAPAVPTRGPSIGSFQRHPISGIKEAMRAVTIKEAKARLNALVDAAVSGEQVVLMRGSKHVAAIVPVSADELELPPRLSDEQAARFWKVLAEERARGGTASFASAEDAVASLAGSQGRPRRSRSPSRRRSRSIR